jgi:serine/threonine protein kinase/tetratricopeptide (TPR) repeat protein
MKALAVRRLWSELSRRKVTRVVVGYLVVAWAVIEVADTVFPYIGLDGWVTLVIALLFLGFPVSVVLAWAYDITPEGVARTPSLPHDLPVVQDIMAAALELETGGRSAYLDRACGGNPSLRREIDSLIEAHERPGLLDRPLGRPARADSPPSLSRAAPHYQVLERIGGGGMGVVYKARDRRLERIVALKFLPPHLSTLDGAKERFLVEAQAAAALDHPNICTIYEAGETDDGQLFLAMPFYAGETLKRRLEQGPLPAADAIDIAVQVAHGLDKAHERGIIHRDIKPANLMLTADGVVKIVDFGVAKLADVDVTRPGIALGTIAYMSPEQAEGSDVDGRTDIWSLGVVLYEMLTGERPFRGGHDRVLLNAITTAEPAPLTTLRPEIPARFEEIVLRALAKRRADRYETAREMADALRGLPPTTGAPLPVGRGSSESGAGAARTDSQPLLQTGETSTGGILAEGERRTATVVAAMIGGYDELVERLAPDALNRLLAELRDEASATAVTHGGVLNEFSGDQLVLLFGVPLAQEDDAVRATRAALDLHARCRRLCADARRGGPGNLGLHTGIDSGTVITHASETAERPFRVSGSAPQVAARLAQHAEADEIWLSPECRALVAPYFETEERAALTMRGRRQPLTPHRVIRESGLHTRIEAAERTGLTAFTGRDSELATLTRCMEEVLNGEGQLVAITGEPGLGKSRLLHEFRQGRARDVPVLMGRCQSYGGGVAYLPFIDILRNGLGIGEDPQNVEAAASSIRSISRTLEEFIPLYLNLLSIRSTAYPVPKHLQGDAFRLAMQEALAAILTLAAQREAGVVILEDWHWADEASQAVLRQVAEVLPGNPLLVVVTSRPGYGVEWNPAGQVTHLMLKPLEAATTGAMLRALLKVDAVPGELVTLIHERTGGNPFFIEEICHALVEDGSLTVGAGEARLTEPQELLELPDSIQGVIRARLDRLDRRPRDVLRVAAVIGREFPRTLLEHALTDATELPQALDALKAAGLIQQTRVAPDALYRFKHVLTQEVAYASLLEHQRRELHGRVGTTIEELHGNHVDDQLDRLAHHFSRAESWAKAVQYGLRSADRASRLAQFAEALQILERTQRWVARLAAGAERDTTLADILLQQERMCETLGLRLRQQQLIDQLITLLGSSSDDMRLAEVSVRQGDLYTLLRRFAEAETALLRSLELRRALGDRMGERNTLRSLGLLRWHEGRNAEALEIAEETLRLDRERGDLPGIVGDLTNCGAILRAMGEHDRARAVIEEALAVGANDEDDESTMGDELALKRVYALHHLANIYREQGDRDRALEALQRAGTIAEEKRLPIQLAYHYTSVAHLYLQEGRVEESLVQYREAVELSRRARYALGLAQSLRIFGEVLVGLGRYEEALPHLQESAATFAELRDIDGEARMWSAVAAAEEKLHHHAQALAAWSRASQLFRQLEDARGELTAMEGLARATRQHLGEPSLALVHFQQAVQLAGTLGDLQAEGRMRNVMAILEWNRGDVQAALAHYERALAVFLELGDDVHAGLMLNSIGATLRSLGRSDAAAARLEEALALHRRTGERQLEGHALALLADLAIEREDAERAAYLYGQSLELRRATGDRRGEGWMLHGLARCELARGVPYLVREHVTHAARIAEECGDGELAAACEQLRRVAD